MESLHLFLNVHWDHELEGPLSPTLSRSEGERGIVASPSAIAGSWVR